MSAPLEKEVVRLWQRGLETDDCIGYRGVSLETIEYLIESGAIPGYARAAYEGASVELPQPGDIYFLPRLQTFPFEKLPGLLTSDRIPPDAFEFALQGCISMAESRAWGHNFAKRLGLDIGIYSFEASVYVEDFDSRKHIMDFHVIRKEFKDKGVSTRAMRKVALLARRRKGVVIGLKKEALDFYVPQEGDLGTDFRINPGTDGLSYTFLSGIKPLGSVEENFFNNLKILRGRP